MQIDDMYLNRLFTLFAFLGLLATNSHAQRGFDLYLVAGMNAAQIEGDNLAGYHKPGLHTGLKAGFQLQDKWELNMEMLFSQKGSRASRNQSLGGFVQTTTLNYLEFPVYVTYNDWFIEDEGYYKVGFHAGLAYSYLVRVKSANALIVGLGNFKNFDMSAFAGAYYAFSRKWSLTVRYSNSFIRIYENDNLPTDGLINYLWTFRVDYHF